MSYNFPATRTTNPKEKPDQSDLGFGRYFTDHMFIMDYDEGEGKLCAALFTDDVRGYESI